MKKNSTPALTLAAASVATVAFGQGVGGVETVPQTVVPSLTSIRLETIRSRDEALLRDLAGALVARYGSLLEGTEILFTRVESFGTVFYRLDIQDIESEEAARRICEILEMDRCLVARPGASPLVTGEAFVIAPDGLIDMHASVQVLGEPVSGSVEFSPLATIPAEPGWEEVAPLKDTLGVLPLDRPTPDAQGAIAAPQPVVSQAEPNSLDMALESARADKPVAAPNLSLEGPAVVRARPSLAPSAAPAVSVAVADDVGAMVPVAQTLRPDAEVSTLIASVGAVPVVPKLRPDGMDALPSHDADVLPDPNRLSRLPMVRPPAPQAEGGHEEAAPVLVASLRPQMRPDAPVAVHQDESATPKKPLPVWKAGPRQPLGSAPAQEVVAQPAHRAPQATPETVVPVAGWEAAQAALPLPILRPAPGVGVAPMDRPATAARPLLGGVAHSPAGVLAAVPDVGVARSSALASAEQDDVRDAPGQPRPRLRPAGPQEDPPAFHAQAEAAPQPKAQGPARVDVLAMDMATPVAAPVRGAEDSPPRAKGQGVEAGMGHGRLAGVDEGITAPLAVANGAAQKGSTDVAALVVADARAPHGSDASKLAHVAGERAVVGAAVAADAVAAVESAPRERSGVLLAQSVADEAVPQAAGTEVTAVLAENPAPHPRPARIAGLFPARLSPAAVKAADAVRGPKPVVANGAAQKGSTDVAALAVADARAPHGSDAVVVEQVSGDASKLAHAGGERAVVGAAVAADAVAAVESAPRERSGVLLAQSVVDEAVSQAAGTEATAVLAENPAPHPRPARIAGLFPARLSPAAVKAAELAVARGAGQVADRVPVSVAPTTPAAPPLLLTVQMRVADSAPLRLTEAMRVKAAQMGASRAALAAANPAPVGLPRLLLTAEMAVEVAPVPTGIGHPAPTGAFVERAAWAVRTAAPAPTPSVYAPQRGEALLLTPAMRVVNAAPFGLVRDRAPSSDPSLVLAASHKADFVPSVDGGGKAAPQPLGVHVKVAEKTPQETGKFLKRLAPVLTISAAPTPLSGSPVARIGTAQTDPENMLLETAIMAAVAPYAETPLTMSVGDAAVVAPVSTTHGAVAVGEGTPVRATRTAALPIVAGVDTALMGAEVEVRLIAAVDDEDVARPKPQAGAIADPAAAQFLVAAAQVAPRPIYSVESAARSLRDRVRADAVPMSEGQRPVDEFLAVWDQPMPLATSQLALATAEPQQWGPTDAVYRDFGDEAVAEPAVWVAPAAPATAFHALGQTLDQVRTLDGFVETLTAEGAIFNAPSVPTFAELAKTQAESQQARALLEAALQEQAALAADAAAPRMALPMVRPDAAGLQGDAPLPAAIRATVGADAIAMETADRRVLAPRQAIPASRYAVVFTDTYAVPFDLSGTGKPPLQRTPLLRPAVVSGDAQAPVVEPTATLISGSTDMSRFFPGPQAQMGDQEASPIDGGQADPALDMIDRLRGGLDETLGALEITMDGAETSAPARVQVAEPIAARPALNLPPLETTVRPLAAAPLVEEPAPEAPAPESLTPGEAQAAATPAPVVAPEEVPTAQPPAGTPPPELGPTPSDPVPFAAASPAWPAAGAGSILDRDTRRVAPAQPNEGLMIRLSYAASPDEVTVRVRDLMRNFPQSMLEKGRFYGAAAPASPGLYIVGIQAHNAIDREDLVAYMTNNGIPFVLPGQSAAPLLATP